MYLRNFTHLYLLVMITSVILPSDKQQKQNFFSTCFTLVLRLHVNKASDDILPGEMQRTKFPTNFEVATVFP